MIRPDEWATLTPMGWVLCDRYVTPTRLVAISPLWIGVYTVETPMGSLWRIEVSRSLN